MKSITVTTHRAINYGGVLQAYALQKYLFEHGVENELLHLPRVTSYYRKIDAKSIKGALFSIYCNLNAFLFKKDALEVENKFAEFIEEYLRITRLYETREELFDNPPEADFYITGSDQVFSVRHKQSYARLLEFAPADKPVFSYAASLGEYDWTEEEKQLFQKSISRFSSVSVREAYAKKYLESIYDNEIHVNLDPVFLLDKKDYEEIAVLPKIEGPYILVYPLISNTQMQDLIDKARNELGIKTVSVRVSRNIKYKCDEYVYNAGPREFLGLLLNASAVVTTSFHGAALSILFNKPFYVAIKNFKSQRITDLLAMFNMKDRLYEDSGNLNFNMDFDLSNQIISSERKKSEEYVKAMIESAKQLSNGKIKQD